MDTLVLNSDGMPVSYLPLSAVDWKEAIQYLYMDKCTVLEWYDDWMVHSPSWETKVPAVIMLKDFMRRRKTPRFSKYNVFLRDEYHCQYCGSPFARAELTLDHVLPVSRGGKTAWDNIVSACGPCNAAKGNKLTPLPMKHPYQPDYWELVNKRKKLPFEVRHPSWNQWLGL